MTPDDTERMAREAGDAETDSRGRVTFSFDSYGLARFAALVEAAERERCANVCKEMAERMERSAQICADNGEADEVSPLRSTAWQLTVAADLIEKERSS